ncbi:MAG: hypothetical protein IJ806_08400 [Ruminococcus sp.]|nr:hypothetical protein [Ruminococcus sp.]
METLQTLGRLTRELGISSGTLIIVLVLLYFIIKWGVSAGIKSAYDDIHACKSFEEDGNAPESRNGPGAVKSS